jgi:hypothetical protein
MSYNTGPAALKIGAGPYLYSEQGFNLKLTTESRKLVSDLHGELKDVFVSRSVVITGKELGRVSSGFLASLLPASIPIGGSIFTGTDAPVIIWTLAGQKITWARGAVTKFPKLLFSATKELYAGDVEITCLGATASAATATGHWNAITSVAFAEATFDPALVFRAPFTAAYGDAPFDAMTAQEGFTVDIEQQVSPLKDDNIGLADMFLTGLSASCSFVPSNLSEVNLWTLLNLQGATALTPGQNIDGGEAADLVITGDDGVNTLAFTLNKPGFKDAAAIYKAATLRTGEIMAVASRSFTSGVIDPLFTFTQTSDS